jgi:uncharacterized damage-inducible protein DinB
MYTYKQLIFDLEDYNNWVSALKNIKKENFFEPIAPGKWSIAEIISHITFWDNYLLEEILPLMKKDANLTPVEDYDAFNKVAADFALSGVSQEDLINRQLKARAEVVSILKEKTEEEMFANFTIYGEKKDGFSGEPNSIFTYFAGFVWHDNHHKKQVEDFLTSINVSIL